MEFLRCPTCLSLLLDANAKRCPTCHAKLRRRARPTVLAEGDDLGDRPLPLVEQELQARIEAKTASGFLKRRRAARAARRIAALPSTVLAGDIVLTHGDAQEPAPEPPAPPTATDAPTIIDLPAEAVHDVVSTAEADYVRAEPVVEAVVEPEPVVEVVVEPEPEVEVVAEPEPEVEVVAEPEPVVPRRKPRRRAPKAARIEGLLDDVEEVAEPPAAPKRKPRAAAVIVEPPVVEPPVAEPSVVEPAVVEPEPVVEVVAEPEPEPEPVEPEVVVPEVVEAEVGEPEPVPEPEVVEATPAANWGRSNTVWTQRVFNTAPRVREAETVSWPPRWKPADALIDLTEDSESDQMDASR